MLAAQRSSRLVAARFCSTVREAPVLVRKRPYAVDVEEGKTYFWCACGLSTKQPWCDGSHKGRSTLRPVRWKADRDNLQYFCGCKRTDSAPMCDGTHNFIKGDE